ncbi:putative metal-dependent hydrolase domain protein [Orientia tsutsugamushi str. Kato PP]|nr:putative metal-dependent hydrolase domain protein [Orientia tsutsugamushi str. Kato PP]
MTFSYKLIDLTHALDSTIPTWNGGCGFHHDVHIDYSDCQGEDKFRVMKVKMHAGGSARIWMRQATVFMAVDSSMILMSMI